MTYVCARLDDFPSDLRFGPDAQYLVLPFSQSFDQVIF